MCCGRGFGGERGAPHSGLAGIGSDGRAANGGDAGAGVSARSVWVVRDAAGDGDDTGEWTLPVGVVQPDAFVKIRLDPDIQPWLPGA